MRKQRIVGIPVFVLLLLSLTACGSTDLTKGKSAQEIVTASAEAMQKLKTYSISMNMNMDILNPDTDLIENIGITGSGNVVIDPMKMHMKMNIDNPQTPMDMEIYAVNEDNKIIEYLNIPGKPEEWMKIELPLDEEMVEMMNPARSVSVLKEALLDAQILGEEKIDNTKLLVIETTLKPEAFSKFMQMPGSDMLTGDLENIFSAMGNFRYKIWVRKDNLYIAKAEIDLGQIFKDIYEKQTDISEEDKKILSQMKALVISEYSGYDNPVEITIPDEIIKNAQDFSELLNTGN